jgi:leucyl aminopeptidase
MKVALDTNSAHRFTCDLLVVGVTKAEGDDGKSPPASTTKKTSKKATSSKSAKASSKGLARPTEVAEIDDALQGLLWEAAVDEGFKGDDGQTFVFHTHGKIAARKVALIGLGVPSALLEDSARKLGGRTVKAAGELKTAALVLPSFASSPVVAVEACTEGALLADYRFDRYLTDNPKKPTLETLTILVDKGDEKSAAKGLVRGEAIAAGVVLARDLVNECPMALTPAKLAEEAKTHGKKAGLTVEILDEKAIEKERMGLVMAVSRAASPYTPARVVVMRYRPAKKAKKHVALVGKGLTFDSGGLDIKPAAGMLDMKVDMSGAAAVVGAMIAIARLKPDLEVTGYLGCVENGIGGNAYHPGDVLTSRKGLTVEINNTDAEGRLVLADVIDFAITKDKPDLLIDLATLTGACMVALGPTTAGLFTADDVLAEDIRNAGIRVGEDFWRLPLNPDLAAQLKSPIADMRNTGDRYGGAITAALFLKRFVDDRVRWAHLDIAGPATNEKDHAYSAKGGTGFGVRTLTALLAPRV